MENYTQLLSDIKDWTSSPDMTDAQLDNFITIATSEINRTIRIGGMETETDLTLSAKTVALPTDFRGARGLYIAGSGANYELRYVTPEVLNSFEQNSTGRPRFFTIRNATLVLDATPDESYTAKLHYFQKFTVIDGTTTTNWLTDEAPDALLWGACWACSLFNRDDDQAARFRGLFDNALSELEQSESDKYGPVPVASIEASIP